ncbi:MAG TPA: zinc-dependent metalloprotease [Acidimicrobiia bacterium]|nr:zinc-dependent metalloprotease [Acidimicrobiia bacterium]
MTSTEMTEVRAPDPVDWPTARRIARLVAGRDPLSDSYLAASLQADFEALTVHAEELVAEHTGLRAPGNVTARVLDRRQWVDSNLTSMRTMLDPLMQRFGARLVHSPLAPMSRRVAAGELGALLGFLSQRVLGQYDLLVPDAAEPGMAGGEARGQGTDAGVGDAVYYVGANVLGLEKRFAFRPRDFRLWIAIHEVTHRAQFTGVPWMRAYFLGLVRQAFDLVDPDPRTVLRAVTKAVDEIRAGRNPLDDGGVVGLFASPEQRGVLSQVQALMSLLEGHGNVVMDDLGSRHVVGQERMSRVLQARRQQRGITSAVHKLLGLEQKMRQYEVGEKFVRGAIALAGPNAVDAAWEAPGNLPTLAELDAPDRWLFRVSPARAGLGR